MKRLLLAICAAMLLLTGCGARNQVMDGPGMMNTYRQISQDEAKEMMLRDDGHVVVDVRRQDEFDAGHIPGAILLPNEDIGDTPPAALPDKNQIILIYCRSGNRSKQASQKLFDMGYTNIYEFGGINSWTGEIVTEKPAEKVLWTAAEEPVSIRYDRRWAYSDSAELTDLARIREIVEAVKALTVGGPTDACTEDYTDILSFTFADGTTARLEFEDQNWVTETGARLQVEGLPRLRGLLDEVLTEAEEAGPLPALQNGERYEKTIILEGMEETVRYEHIRNDALGFEIDYDYELLERRSETDRECFVCRYDDPKSPENYLEVTFDTRDAETVAASVSEALSGDYSPTRESYTLRCAGECIRIDASADKSGLNMPPLLQMVYIIPAADRCRVATAHYAIEGADGFGRRFSDLMDTLIVIPR